jgi:adenylyl-sulfate kinase
MALPRSPEVTWHAGATREERFAALGQRGATVWFTGLPSSGKSTIAAGVEERLLAAGRPAYLLDGDNLRHGVCGDLGFSRDDRSENVRRAAHVAHLFADAGLVALVSLVSPHATDRARARELHEADGLPFIEVYVSTPAAECERRDPKGLWARARAGELRGFTGVDDPYEVPAAPELELAPSRRLDEAVGAVLALLPPPER